MTFSKAKYRTEDGFTFYQQPDGSLTDTWDAAEADLTFARLADLLAVVDVVERIDEEQTRGVCPTCGGTNYEHSSDCEDTWQH
jgi:hypothetical protein